MPNGVKMRIRVYQLAKEFDLSGKELLVLLKELKVAVKSHMSSLDDETAELVRHEIKDRIKKPAGLKELAPGLRPLEINIPITVKDLSIKLSLKPSELIGRLIKMGIFANINQLLEEEVVKKAAKEYGCYIEKLLSPEEALIKEHEAEDKAKLAPRPPVVTLMGHVDHGKTSLLDTIRKSKIVETEAGAITQHIGAYEIDLEKGKVIFLDTPGHEAFTRMRARGAQATDVVVLVVAADDGIMPQTIEAIDHARAAGVPIVVAINKIDLPGADIDRIKGDLQKFDLIPEDLGGKTICVQTSAKTKDGINELLEMLLLEAEMLELKANPDRPAKGIIVEASICKGKGVVATVLVQNGTLRVGDCIVSGEHSGKIKAMRNDRGRMVKEAAPSIPVEIMGLSGVPQAGDHFYVVSDEKKAKQITLEKQEEARRLHLEAIPKKITLEELSRQILEGKVKQFNIIVKADVQGSVEVLLNSLEKIKSEEIKVNMIHSGVGSISESDVLLASASGALIIGFHIQPEVKARQLAAQEGVELRLYDVIYEVIEEIRKAMEGMLEPLRKEVFLGRAKVREVFKVSKTGIVAGSMVTKGKFLRTARARVIRDDTNIYEGKINSLKRFKDDVREVQEGFECGIALEGCSDIKVDDIIEAYQIEEEAAKL